MPVARLFLVLEAGKKRLAGDTAREATSDEVRHLRHEALALKEVVAELTLDTRLLKKSMIRDGGEGALMSVFGSVSDDPSSSYAPGTRHLGTF